MLHYNSISGSGIFGFILTFYAFKAYRWSIGDPISFEFQEGSREIERNSVPEMVFRLLSCVSLDIFTNEVLIKFLFGPDATIWQDLVVKRFCLTSAMCILINSRKYDNLVRRIFRPKQKELKKVN